MSELQKIKLLWKGFLKQPFPQHLAGKEIEGIELALLDSFAAGCVSVFLERGRLDKEREVILERCFRELSAVIPNLEDRDKPYFVELHSISEKVLSNLTLN